MDVRFINPFLNGTKEVLKKMAAVEAVAGKPYLKNTNVAAGDVSAIIGLTGDTIGSLAISFSEACICYIAGNIVGEIFTAANQDVFDAAGEITNMVSGVARSYLEKEGLTVFAAIPSIIYGKGHTFQHILKAPSIVVPFSTEKGDFIIDVCLKTVTASEKKHQVYDVVNVKTLDMGRSSALPPVSSTAPGTKADTAPAERQKVVNGDQADLPLLKERLAALVQKRGQMQEELLSKPFMPLERRNKLKKEVSAHDAQIKHLKLDIRTIEMMANIAL